MRFGLVFVTDYEGTERELYCWFKYIMSIMYIVYCRRERSDKNWSTIRKRRHEKKQSNTANQLEYFNVLFFTFIIFMFCYIVFFITKVAGAIVQRVTVWHLFGPFCMFIFGFVPWCPFIYISCNSWSFVPALFPFNSLHGRV